MSIIFCCYSYFDIFVLRSSFFWGKDFIMGLDCYSLSRRLEPISIVVEVNSSRSVRTFFVGWVKWGILLRT